MEILGGSHARIRPSAQQIKAVKEGGYKADTIRMQANTHHESIDVPKAEMMLEIALSEQKNTQIINEQPTQLSFWGRTIQTIKTFFSAIP